MKIKTTRFIFLLGTLLVSQNLLSQIIVSAVFPTRVTKTTEVTITGGSGFTNSTPVSFGISYNSKSASNGGTQLNFTIDGTGPDTSGTLQINGQNVYIGSNSPENLVTITYVRPRARKYDDRPSANSFRITEIFTDWNYNNNGYYRSSWYSSSDRSTWPDDRHDLLAFTVDNKTYSTGVNNTLLDNKGITYEDQIFKAYSTNGISGNPHGGNYLAMADLIEGEENRRVLNDLVRATVYDVIIDGKNGQGLDLGTGITNFNKEASISFFSGNGVVGAVNDGVPDLVLTQMAQAGGTDIYYYSDIDGNVVGRPIELSIKENSSSPILFNWYLDLYRMDRTVPYAFSYPAGTSFGNNDSRPYRMIAFELEDFGIIGGTATIDLESPKHISKIRTINMQAGGTADVAFIAYNKSAFNIKSPEIDQFPVSRNICEVPSNIGVTFNVSASVDDPAGVPEEDLFYQWYRDFEPIMGATSNAFPLSGITTADLGNYKVRVSNAFGAVDLPVTLSEGGTPTFWNGSVWELPAALINAGVTTVDDADRNLIFNEDYNEATDLEGCDCTVLAEKDVIIPSGYALKLYGDLEVQGPQDIFDIDGNDTGVDTAAGTLVFENNASLVQIKNVTLNQNSGDILMKRIPKSGSLQNYDYLYWSSPVEEFAIGDITGNVTLTWDPTIDNNPTRNNFGNWVGVTDTEEMLPGKGYIKRWNGESAPSGEAFAEFTGVPRNGVYTVPLASTPSGGAQAAGERNWNLIGNPYPSAINVKTFLEVNTGSIEGAVNLWTHGSSRAAGNPTPFYQGGGGETYNPDDYIVSNLTGTTPDTAQFEGNIASGQGFFVKALDGGINVEFNNTMRYDDGTNGGNGNADPDSGTYGNDNFFRGAKTTQKGNSSNDQKLWLSVIDQNQVASTTLIGYVDGATYGKDNLYDATANGTSFGIYSLIDDQEMIIQGRPTPFLETDIVPIGVNLNQTGIYSIGIDNLEGSLFVNQEQTIYLEDVYTGIVHDLRQAPYSFSAEIGEIKDRFLLRYTNIDATLSVANQNVLDTFVFVNDEFLNIKSNKKMKTVEVFDLTGKRVVRHYTMNETEIKKEFNYANSVYLINILFYDGSTLTKKVLN